VGKKTPQPCGCDQAEEENVNPNNRTMIIILNRIGHLPKGKKNFQEPRKKTKPVTSEVNARPLRSPSISSPLEKVAAH
jgi:hypothetical protein